MNKHTVVQGETMHHIARAHGFTVERLWTLPENKGLKDKKRREDLLSPGDVVHLPDLEIGTVAAPSEEKHRFVLKLKPLNEIRVALLYEDKPRKNVQCTLVINEIGLERSEQTATADGDGIVMFAVPFAASGGTLSIGEDESYRLRFNHLDPISEDSGLQQRLFNLGYRVDPSTPSDDQTRQALLDFQHAERIEETGENDDATLTVLEKKYGS